MANITNTLEMIERFRKEDARLRQLLTAACLEQDRLEELIKENGIFVDAALQLAKWEARER